MYCPIDSFLLFFITRLPHISFVFLATLSTVLMVLHDQREKKSALNFNLKREKIFYMLGSHKMLVSEKES